MQYSRRTHLIILLMSLYGLLAFATVQAQSEPGPLFIYEQGQLYTWDGPGQAITPLPFEDGQPFTMPRLSPDGTRMVYNTFTSIFTAWLETVDGAGGFQPPTDLYIFDLPSGQTYRIAGQPDGAFYTGPDSKDAGNYILRPFATWSPEGDQLAWLELSINTQSSSTGILSLIVYDLVSRTTRTVDSFSVSADPPPSIVSPDSPAQNQLRNARLAWGPQGIAMFSPSNGNTLIQVYTLNSERIANTEIAFGFRVTWIEYRGEAYLLNTNRPDSAFNPNTGETITLTGSLELYSLTAPDGAYFAQKEGLWVLHLPDGTRVDLEDGVIPWGISRDGQQGVYGRQITDANTGFLAQQIIVHSQDQQLELGTFENNIQVNWGPTGWRIRD